jgi:hypothetical protein
MQKEANERAKQMEQEKDEGEQVSKEHISIEDNIESSASLLKDVAAVVYSAWLPICFSG